MVTDQDVNVAVLPAKLVLPTNVHTPFGSPAIKGAQLFVVAGVVDEPTVGLKEAFAAQIPVHGAPAPIFGIGVIPAELIVVFTKLAPLLVVPELNKFITLALGALRFNSRLPSNDSVALKLTAIPVTVAPVGIPLIV